MVTPLTLKKKEYEALYDGVLKQTGLRTIHEAFESLYTQHVKTVVVNGWVTALNAATGHDETPCVVPTGRSLKRSTSHASTHPRV